MAACLNLAPAGIFAAASLVNNKGPAIAAVAALIINSLREFACTLFFIGLGF